MQPLDLPMGAGTFHPATFLRAIGPEPWACAYVQPCRRPTDGRYGDNPNRLQHYYQFQVALKPSPPTIQDDYLSSLSALGLSPLTDDIRFVDDNWESPTLGAWGLGWEVWLNGMEISQFTYFQQVGGMTCQPIMGEITYGLERLSLALFAVDNVYDIPWCQTPFGVVTYGDLFKTNEAQCSEYNFKEAKVASLMQQFSDDESQAKQLLAKKLIIPAYELILQASHTFNLLDARNAIAQAERQRYILRLNKLTQQVAQAYYASRADKAFPLLNRVVTRG